MLDYQDFEQTKRELMEAQAEYLKKKENLKEEREKIVWNIEIFERMVGDTNLFNDIKKENTKEEDEEKRKKMDNKKDIIITIITTFLIVTLCVTVSLFKILNDIIM